MRQLRIARRGLLVLGLTTAMLVLASAAQATPGNDDFAAATPIAPGAAATTASNAGAGRETGEPAHAGDPGGHSVWFRWTPAKSGTAGVNVSCMDSLDAAIGVYTGAAVGALTEVASNGDGPPPFCPWVYGELEFAVTAGTTYWIAIDGKAGDEGSFNLFLSSVPANDDFVDATVVEPALPQDVASSTRHATRQPGEPNHAGDSGGRSVWFEWTPAETERVEISTCSSMIGGSDTLLAVYTGTGLGSLEPVAANDDVLGHPGVPACSGLDSALDLDAVAGTTYWIAVDGAGETSSTVSLRLRGRPANDDFAAARVLTAPGFSVPLLATASQVSRRLATKEAGEPEHAGDPGGHSIWFSWTATQSGRVAATTCTHEPWGQPDTTLGVYTGSTVDELTTVAANDDAGDESSCAPTDSAVVFDAVLGTTYWIAVDGKEDAGRFDLHLTRVAPNDEFADAQTLGPGLPAYAEGDNRFALKQLDEPNHAGDPGGSSVWFRWTPDVGGTVLIKTCPSVERGGDTLLGVYTGSGLGALTQVAANDDSPAACRRFASAVKLDVAAGTTYWIAVDSTGGGGRFSLQVTAPETNDDFAAASELAPDVGLSGGSTVFATKQPGEPAHAGRPGGHSVWYSWTPSVSGPVAITVCGGGGGDTLLGVYTGASLDSLATVASNGGIAASSASDLCEQAIGISAVTFDAVAGTTYRIAVDSEASAVGPFSLVFERRPANDDFAAASELTTALPSYGSAVTRLAGKQLGEPNHAGHPGGHSVWFKWTPKASARVSISTCAYNGDLDTLLAVYTGSSLGGLTALASNDDSSAGCAAGDSELVLDAVAGTTYWIAVDGKGGNGGGFHLRIEGVAANDSFSRQQGFGSSELPIDTWASNRFASKQPGEDDHAGNAGGASVWFKWSAPRSGQFSVDTCGSGFDTLLAVYTGGAVDELALVESNDDAGGRCGSASRLTFTAVAGTPYRIAVDGKGGAEGRVELYLTGPPRNDAFGKSEAIPGTRGWYWPGSTLLAGKEPGEPNHGGDPGGHSVWFSWTPTQGGATELHACADSFDLRLGIYAGAALGSLAPVVSTDLGRGLCEEGRALGFDAVADTTYRFAIDGADGAAGHFDLQLTGPTVKPPPPGPDPGIVPGLDQPPPPGAAPQSPPAPTQPAPPKRPKPPLKCKPGFKKVKVKGKQKCVKKPGKGKGKRNGNGRKPGQRR